MTLCSVAMVMLYTVAMVIFNTCQVHGFRDGRGWPGLRTLHPSQARCAADNLSDSMNFSPSLSRHRLTLLKDPCYEDHTHHSKKHSDL